MKKTRFKILLAVSVGAAAILSATQAQGFWGYGYSRSYYRNNSGFPPTDARRYGTDGTITLSESRIVRGLMPRKAKVDRTGWVEFPQEQSRYAITSRIGYPEYEDETSSYYKLADNSGYFRMDWDGGKAVGGRITYFRTGTYRR